MTRSRDDLEQGDPSAAAVLDRGLEALVLKSLEKLLPLMTPELTEVFRRAEFLGESHEVIAASLVIDIETVESRLHAARKELQRFLEYGARYHLDRP